MIRHAILLTLALNACTGDRARPSPIVSGDAGSPSLDGGVVGPDGATTVPGPCGELTELGACDGTVLSWCESDAVRTIDCATLFPAPARGSCERISDFYGYGCAVQPGDPCGYQTTDGESIIAFCAGAEPGCVFLPEGGTECRQNVGVCLRDLDVGACTTGGGLIIGCEGGGFDTERIQGQPTIAPCTEMGGGCERDRCVALPEGAQCVEGAALELVCDAGLDCEAGYCEDDGGVTFRMCADSTRSGACTNTADCGIIDGDPETVMSAALDCLVAGGDVPSCVRGRTGLSTACSACFADPDATRFEACAGF